MITNLLLKGEYKIEANKWGKIEVPLVNGEIEKVVDISTKNIPFVRFRPKEYTLTTVEYIKYLQENFMYSCIVLELNVNEYIIPLLKEINDIDKLDNLIIYYRLQLNEKDKEELYKNKLDILSSLLKERMCDRLMIIPDFNLFYVDYEKIKENISRILDIKYKNIGICNNALSFSEDCCLTAVRARELIALYGTGEEIALPTSRHENMNTCGCIRHLEICGDILVCKKEEAQKISKTNKSTEDKGRNKKGFKKIGSDFTL